jgi:hypothetical protein
MQFAGFNLKSIVGLTIMWRYVSSKMGEAILGWCEAEGECVLKVQANICCLNKDPVFPSSLVVGRPEAQALGMEKEMIRIIENDALLQFNRVIRALGLDQKTDLFA